MEQTISIIDQLPFSAELKEVEHQLLSSLAMVKDFEEGHILTKQFAPSEAFYFLLEGSVSFSITMDEVGEVLEVGQSSAKYTPIGWSGFRTPYRFATTVTCQSKVSVLYWNNIKLRALFDEHPHLGQYFIGFVALKSISMLQIARDLLTEASLGIQPLEYPKSRVEMPAGAGFQEYYFNQDLIGTLRSSPFLEIFPESHLQRLAQVSVIKHFEAGDVIQRQGEEANFFYILARGRVMMKYKGKGQKEETPIEPVEKPGYVVAWAGLCVDQINGDTTIEVQEETWLVECPKAALMQAYVDNPKLAMDFMYRLLWLLSNRLSAVRTQIISQRFEQERLTVTALLQHYSSELGVTSKLHKVPYLIDSPYTMEEAFTILNQVARQGSTLEKSLERLISGVLKDMYKEHCFFEGLGSVYHQVVTAPSYMTSDQVRNACAEMFVKIFDQVPYEIQGLENLPDTGGNIFIYNHLLNHPYNTLPNNFQLTLDSHFISSVILYQQYKDAGIRVVRIGKGVEYGHQDYYERLGHIGVYTKDSDEIQESPEERRARLSVFFKEASDYLENGYNLMLSPEGTSLETNQSPGLFKPGAFRIAASVKPEPLIVPLAVANFDKRMNRTKLGIVIKKPFKVSERVEDPSDKEQMRVFLENYHLEYKEYVAEAIALTEER